MNLIDPKQGGKAALAKRLPPHPEPQAAANDNSAAAPVKPVPAGPFRDPRV